MTNIDWQRVKFYKQKLRDYHKNFPNRDFPSDATIGRWRDKYNKRVEATTP